MYTDRDACSALVPVNVGEASEKTRLSDSCDSEDRSDTCSDLAALLGNVSLQATVSLLHPSPAPELASTHSRQPSFGPSRRPYPPSPCISVLSLPPAPMSSLVPDMYPRPHSSSTRRPPSHPSARAAPSFPSLPNLCTLSFSPQC